MIGLLTAATGSGCCAEAEAVPRLGMSPSLVADAIETVDSHHLVTTRVDDLHGYPLMGTNGKWQRGSAAERGERFFVDDAFEGTRQPVPGASVREESLRDAEGLPIIVSIQELGSDLIRAGGQDGVLDRVIDIHTLHLDHVLTVPLAVELRA